ncbi:hypothetical protein B0A52_08986 [Exophiala mesophila]|uniref:Ribonuclease n=1 Tax=Exophiala mesophila TaxID=212818 RepID=A0A438MUK9_EXOME|nr:hypothetical protein B0A52_08986 [Exophiala mesophila]
MEDDSNAPTTFCPGSVKEHEEELLTGRSYAHYSAVPKNVTTTSSVNINPGTPCVLGVDEAGRGPVIGPMVYGVFYLPVDIEQSLLATTHHFDDSKVLTPAVRAALMQAVCTQGTDLFNSCGWAVKSLSAPDIGAGMLKNGGSYNLNAQAMDATVELIRGVIQQGVNVTELYVDTIGRPETYQKKLQLIFPTVKVRVEKKADSLYPCVSAASVVAKVTRDVSCEALLEAYVRQQELSPEDEAVSWGSGYPSDARCVSWLKAAIDPVWGFGNECRFSWGTVKDMLEQKGGSVKRTDWPADGDQDNMRLSSYFAQDGASGPKNESDELRTWFGSSIGQEAF